jgi:hypothetical protein
MVKDYPGAHNHLLIGEIIELTSTFIRARCRTFHFGSTPNSPKNVYRGESAVRVIPWNRVEIVNELPATFDFADAKLVRDAEGGIVLRDRRDQDCTIVPAYAKTY